MQKTIYIPLKKHLVDYYSGQAFEHSNSCKNFVGSVLNGFLVKTPIEYVFTPPLGSYLEVSLVSINQLGVDIRGNVYLPPKSEKMVQRILDKHFNHLFFSYMDDKKRYTLLVENKVRKPEITTLILCFCVENNIEFTDTILDLLKKKYYRENNKKSFHQSVPKLSLASFL